MIFTPSLVCNGAVSKTGAPLKLIEREGFNVFLTGDKNMENQQRLEGRPSAVLIMSAINWPVVRPYIIRISAVLDEARPGTVKTVDCGVFIARTHHPNKQVPTAAVDQIYGVVAADTSGRSLLLSTP